MGKRAYVPKQIRDFMEQKFEDYSAFRDGIKCELVTNQRLWYAGMTMVEVESVLEYCSPRMREFAERALIRPEGKADEVAVLMGVPKGRGLAWKAQLIYALAAKSGAIQERFTPTMVDEYPRAGRIYGIWSGMMQRCYNPNASGYENYGGRGVTVCTEWRKSFFRFEEWARKNGYADNLTIDRKDNNGIYEPQNCRWATKRQQQNNRRNNVVVEVNGEKMTVAEAADMYGIERSKAYKRARLGWTGDEIIKA